MSYNFFSEAPVGTVKRLHVEFGQLSFIKESETMWYVGLSLKNESPFVYTHFTQLLTSTEASSLFDYYEK